MDALKQNQLNLSFTFYFIAVMFLSACSGGGGGGGGGSANFNIGGALSGLAAGLSVTLQNNGSDDLVLSADGGFTFPTTASNGDNYNVQVSSQPVGQTCSTSNNTGTIPSADVSNVTVTCANTTFTVGGTLTGLALGGVDSISLQNNGGDDLTLSGNGLFVFSTPIANGAGYSVQITGQPAGKSCTATNNTGVIAGANSTSTSINCVSNAGSGTLDVSFNAGSGSPGVVIAEESMALVTATGLDSIIDINGKILVSGTRGSDMAIWRFNSDGTLDTSFNAVGPVPGLVTHDGAAGGVGVDQGVAITIDANGKILVTGLSRSPVNFDMAIWRYNNNGSLDTTFNSTGFLTTALGGGGSGTEVGNDIMVDANGKILVAGSGASKFNISFDDMVIWRYNNDGTLDTSFNPTATDGGGNIGAGDQGIISFNGFPAGAGSERAKAITIDVNGKILVGGSQQSQTGFALALWRYNADGTLDTSLNQPGAAIPGRFTLSLGVHFRDLIEDLALDTNQKIVLVGSGGAALPGPQELIALRVNSNGTLDTSFNPGGVVPGSITFADAGGSALAIDSMGRLVITGVSENATPDFDMTIWRYNADGSLDTSFNPGGSTPGIVTHHNAAMGSGFDDFGRDVVFDNLGNIVVTGYSIFSNISGFSRTIVWRYLP